MLIQNKHWGSTIGIIVGILGIFALAGVVSFGEKFHLIAPSHPSLYCDAGCFPVFVLIIIFGSIAYRLRKQHKLSTVTGWKSGLWYFLEAITVALFLVATLGVRDEDLTFRTLAWISTGWVVVAYIALLFSKPRLVQAPVSKKLWAIFILGMILACSATLWTERITMASLEQSYNKRVISTESKQTSVTDLSKEALTVLKKGDYQALSALAHPAKGIRFSPYEYMSQSDLVLSKDELEHIDVTKKYVWGTGDATGFPIEYTFPEYIKSFVYDKEYLDSAEVRLNQPHSGSTTNIDSVNKIFPQAQIVEYYYPGTEQYDNMDWSSVRLVFEEYQGAPYLVGVIHSAWSI